MLTLVVQLLVLVQIIKLLVKLVEMSEPSIQSYQRPMSEEVITDLGEVILSEFHYNFGILFTDQKGAPYHLPASMGRVMSYVEYVDSTNG